MTLLNELQNLEELYNELKSHVYSDTYDEPYMADGEFISVNPFIPEKLFSDIEGLLLAINDDLDSSLIEEIINYFNADSSIGEYVNFDEDDFQMEHIQNDPEAYDEGLSAAQETAASLANEQKSDLWNQASKDVKYLFEDLFVKLF